MNDALPVIASSVWALRRIHNSPVELNGAYAQPPITMTRVLTGRNIQLTPPGTEDANDA